MISASPSRGTFGATSDKYQVLCKSAFPFSLSSFQLNPADQTASNWTVLPPYYFWANPAPWTERRKQPTPMRCSGRLRPHTSSTDNPLTQTDAICSDFVTGGCVLTFLQRPLVEFAGTLAASLNLQDLLLELLWLLVSGNRFTERILLRLSEQESAEPDPHLRDDLRISWITTLYAARGYEHPHIAASQQVLGLHPDHVFAKMQERRELTLGRVEYEKFCAEERARQLPPKKAAKSVRRSEKKPAVSVGVQEQEKQA